MLLVWGTQDRLFPLPLAERLAAILSDARLVTVPDCYTFVPEDQPGMLSAAINDFLDTTVQST